MPGAAVLKGASVEGGRMSRAHDEASALKAQVRRSPTGFARIAAPRIPPVCSITRDEPPSYPHYRERRGAGGRPPSPTFSHRATVDVAGAPTPRPPAAGDGGAVVGSVPEAGGADGAGADAPGAGRFLGAVFPVPFPSFHGRRVDPGFGLAVHPGRRKLHGYVAENTADFRGFRDVLARAALDVGRGAERTRSAARGGCDGKLSRAARADLVVRERRVREWIGRRPSANPRGRFPFGRGDPTAPNGRGFTRAFRSPWSRDAAVDDSPTFAPPCAPSVHRPLTRFGG